MTTFISQSVDQSEDQILIDARGARFAAILTSLVLATTLVTSSGFLATFQLAIFAIGGVFGPQFTPYSKIFQKIVRPRLKGAVPTEDVRPPRFAQRVGFVFLAVALVGKVLGMSALFTTAIAFALAAAFLNAAFNFCLGCELYLRITLLTSRK